MTDPLLAVEGVSVRYGGVPAVSDVSFDVGRGEIVGLIGPNGAGKTSLVDALSGFTRSSGSVRWRGVEISAWPAHKRARAGLARTFQSLELFEDLSVAENLMVFAKDGNLDIDETPLAPSAHCRPSELSYAEQKLLCLERGFVTGAELLFLDEPTAGLDRDEAQRVADRLRDYAAAGIALVVIEHDIDFIASLCPRLVVLDLGRVVVDGPPDQVRADPRVVKSYLGIGSVNGH